MATLLLELSAKIFGSESLERVGEPSIGVGRKVEEI